MSSSAQPLASSPRPRNVAADSSVDRVAPRRRPWLGLFAMLVLVAAPLRLLWIDSYPPDLFYDTAREALDAEAILHGARPVFLPANNGREPLLHYLVALTFSITGPTVFGHRLTVALIGIAGIAATFFWSRAWFGPRVALLASALMAASVWHVFLSRVGSRVILLPLVEALTAWLIWSAARTGRHMLWVAAGLSLGLCAYTYPPIRVFPVVVAAIAVGALIDRRSARARSAVRLAAGAPPLGGIVLMVLVALLAIAPLAVYFIGRPEQFTHRVSQTSIFERSDWPTELGLNALRVLGMFTWRGDEWIYSNVPDRPVFDLVVAPFFLLGVVLSLARVRRIPYALLLIWLGTMLAPGVVTIGAPNFQRTAGAMPPTFVLAAIGMTAAAAWCARRARSWFDGGSRAAAPAHLQRGILAATYAALAAVVLGSALSTARAYFVELRVHPDLGRLFETDVAALAGYARQLPPDEQVYAILPSLPEAARLDHEHASLTFLGRRSSWAFESDAFPIADTRRRAATYLFSNPAEQQFVLGLLPAGADEPLLDSFSGQPLLARRIAAGTAFQPWRQDARTWPNGVRLLGWAMGRAGDGSGEIVLYWSPLAEEPRGGGHYYVSLVDERGRDHLAARFRLRSLVCPPASCGEAIALARRVFLSPDEMDGLAEFHLRLADERGRSLAATDEAGRGVGRDVEFKLAN